ncbi:MAG: autotransporter-associated beta strand repeat-containing protein [Verrucomicrobiota bacterium]|jgi:autotransporter-associated beta strand protein
MNSINTFFAPEVFRHAGRRVFSSVALVLLACGAALTFAASASAQVVGYFSDPLDTTYGGASGANGNALNIGNTFNVTGSGITVYQLGAFNWLGDGLASAHTVTLFSNQVALASVTVPAGTAALLNDGFRFAPLAAPIFLPAGQYAVVSYQMNASDPYGDYNNGIPSDFNTGASVTSGDGIFQFTTNGTAYPNTDAGSYNFISASFTYVDSAGVWSGAGADNNWSTTANWNNGLPAFPTIVTFSGSTRLVNTNDLAGLTLNGITFDPSAGPFVLNGNDIGLNGNISFGAIPAAPATETINLNMAWNASARVEIPTNVNLTLGGDITSSSDTSLIKIDHGTLILAGTNTITSWDLDGGTTTITGNTTINGDGNSRIYVGDGDYLSGCNGTLIIQNGAVLDIIGNYADTFVIGRDSGSGKVVQNGGTFAFNPGNSGTIWLGATGNSATRSEYEMNGGLLDMNGNTLGIGLGNGVLITGLVSQVSGVITNVNNLWVGWGNGNGVYSLSGGNIYIGSTGITTTSGNYAINLGGGTVGATATWGSSLNMNLTGINGPVAFNPAGNTITLSGILSGAGGLTVTGGGTLELSGANTYAGDTIVNGGSTLQLDLTGSSLSAFRLANGALLNLTYSGTYAVANFYTNGVPLAIGTYNSVNLPAFITGSGNLQVAHGISTGLWTGDGANNNWSTGGNWDQNAVPIFPKALTFAGSTRLVNTNDLSGITASGITFDVAAGAFVLGGNDITLAGAIGFNGNPATPVTQTVDFNMAWAGSETIDTPTNGNLALGGEITSSVDTSLIKLDAGTLTLGGTNTIASWDLDGGTTTITGNTTISGDGNSRIYVGDGDAFPNCNGTLIIQNEATLTINGNFADSFVIGRDSGSGTLIQNGGTLTFNPGNAPQNFFIGATSEVGTRSEFDMNGGLLDLNGNNFDVALGDRGVLSTGVVNQVSGAIANAGSLQLGALTATGYGVYNLSGGSIYIGAGGITTVSGNYAINLGGGTVGATASWASALNVNLTNLNGSVTFDTAGNTITLSGVLSGTGGLTVVGSGGTLDLSGGYNYTGDTTVNAGILELDELGSIPGAVHINGAVLNLNYSGTDVVAACYTNGVALPSGVYNSINLTGFITGSGSLTVAPPTPPVVKRPVVSGGNLILTGIGGTAGAHYTWLTSTNVTTPIALWTTNTVGNFDGSGDFSNAIPISTSTPAKFFRLRTP